MINNTKLNKDSRLAYLDIISMYTNVPIDQTIEIVRENLLKNQMSQIETDETCMLLKLVLGQNYYMFNNKCYSQTNGLGMGSPLSGILADIYLNHQENKMIKEIKVIDPSLLWYRYVDDM